MHRTNDLAVIAITAFTIEEIDGRYFNQILGKVGSVILSLLEVSDASASGLLAHSRLFFMKRSYHLLGFVTDGVSVMRE